MLRRSPLSALLLPVLIAAMVIVLVWALWSAALPAMQQIGGAVQRVSGY
jgi:hypothetical protein